MLAFSSLSSIQLVSQSVRINGFRIPEWIFMKIVGPLPVSWKLDAYRTRYMKTVCVSVGVSSVNSFIVYWDLNVSGKSKAKLSIHNANLSNVSESRLKI